MLRDLNDDFFQLSALAESLRMRVEALAQVTLKDGEGFLSDKIENEAKLLISQRLEARNSLRDLLQEVKIIGSSDDLIKHASSFGSIGRALARADLELLEHGDIFITAVQELIPQPSADRCDRIFHEILKIENESMTDAIKRMSFVQEIKRELRNKD